MRAVWFAILAAVMAGLLAMSGGTAQETAQSAESAFLSEMFSDTPLKEERFAAPLLAQVPFPRLTAIVEELKAAIGPVVMVEAKGGMEYVVVSKTHELPVTLILDGENKISGLLFRPPMPTNLSVEEALARLGPASAYLVTLNGEVLHQHRADEPLAVGSAFKLGIIAALKDEIDAGARAWTDVVELKPSHKSLPTGILQDFPDGAPLTLHTAASLMISLSDNTATDLLLDVVGRAKVAARLGLSLVLSTREVFVLKSDAALRARFTKGDAEAALADAVKLPLPDINSVNLTHQQGVEWYLPLTKLCALIGEVAGLDVMQINAGPAGREAWQSVAFKGGSEGGVMNLTTEVTAKDGDIYCVAMTWNGAAASPDEGAVVGNYASVLRALAQNP